MSPITEEFTKEQLQQIIETDHVQCGEASSLARIALASLEAEASGRNPVLAYADSYRNMANHGVESIPVWSVITDLERNIAPLFTAPPAPISVPAAMEMDDDFDSSFEHGKAVGWNAYRAAMLQAEPVSNSDELPLDYLQGHKDGLEWAAQLAEANHPQTGDWLYDDPIDLAMAIRKGPDMPTVQGGNSPVIPDGLRLALSNAGIAAPESDEMLAATCEKYIQALVTWVKERKPFRSAVIPDGWVACSEQMPEENAEQEVLACFKGGDISTLYYFEGRWDDAYGIVPIRQDVTHWMPLPAAPQQEVESQIRKGKTVAMEEWELGARLTKHRFKP